MLLTASVAKKYFGDEDPIGKRLNLNNFRDLEVVGSTIYALTIDSLYRSTNGGATWTRLLADEKVEEIVEQVRSEKGIDFRYPIEVETWDQTHGTFKLVFNALMKER